MAPYDEGFKSNEPLETVFLRKIKVAIPQKMRERWGQEGEWSEKRRQMMLFQDHGGLIMTVLPCSLLMLRLSFISIHLSTCPCLFPWLAVLVIPFVSYRKKFCFMISSARFQKSDRCSRRDVFTQACRQKPKSILYIWMWPMIIWFIWLQVLSKHRRKSEMEDICAGARADIHVIRIADNPKQCVRGPLKATASWQWLTVQVKL